MRGTREIITGFLSDIGITVIEGPVSANSFLPGVYIVNGTIVHDIASLRWPGDLLHEAGHIATMPPALRHLLNDALQDSESAPHAGEVEATAWAYAATVHLGLSPSVLFHDEGYDGRSASLILTYTHGVYPGCFGLSQAAMTLLGDEAQLAAVPAYPHMIRWLRE
jgi:hypothetical protein